MQKFMKYCTILVFIFFATNISAKIIPFDSKMWSINGDGSMDISGKKSQIVTYKGKEALYLSAGGKAVLKDAKFLNGIIEYDIAVPKKRGFMGVTWRMQDNKNFEEFYMRPHQSGNPDANQYTPVYNGISGWQLYYGEQFSVAYKYPFDEWLHVKIVVSDKNAEIFIKDMQESALIVDLKRDVKLGMVGLKAGGSQFFKLAGGYFANFDYTPMEKVSLSDIPAEVITPKNSVLKWEVSNTLSQKELNGIFELDRTITDKLQWSSLTTDNRGVANFASLRNKTKKKNTLFAKIKLNSDKEQIKKVDFGFSDRVKVYFNNKLLFSANDTYRTRDYRFLGTIGYYDSLYFPLKKGENEIWFAVSESFGGWGIQAKFSDFDGIKLQ